MALNPKGMVPGGVRLAFDRLAGGRAPRPPRSQWLSQLVPSAGVYRLSGYVAEILAQQLNDD